GAAPPGIVLLPLPDALPICNGVESVVVVEATSRVRGDGAVRAAIDDAEGVVPHDVPGESDAAAAENAALVIEDDARPEIDGLGLDRKSTRLNSSHVKISYAV